jgi:hypothetical protein
VSRFDAAWTCAAFVADFSNETPMLRLAFAIVALSITLSIGGFVDFLASGIAAIVSHGWQGARAFDRPKWWPTR